VNVLGLRRSLLVWLVLILTAGFLSISVLSYLAARNTIRGNIVQQNLPLTGDSIYSEVQRQILQPVFISAQMAENTFLRDWILNGERDQSKITQYLGAIQQRFKGNTSFFISERTRNYYHPRGIVEVIDQKDPKDAWYFRARQMKTPYELNTDPDYANRDRLTIFINYRVLDNTGRFLGITGVGVTFDTLTELIQRIEKRFNQRVFFTDQSGRIVLADPNAAALTGSIRSIAGLSSSAAQILSNKNPQQLSYQRDGTDVQVNSRFIPELNWYLLVEQDEAAAFAPIWRLLIMNLLLGALATALVLGLTVFVINQYQRRLERLAAVDSLTEAATRSFGEGLLEQAHKEASRDGNPLSLALFDLDDFKRINDTFGHAAGDAVLRQVVRGAKEQLRQSDTIVRWGGEEFLVILRQCPLEHGVRITEQLRAALVGQPGTTTISVGVAQLQPQEDLAALLRRTDVALYRAKHSGKNKVISSEAVATPT
jgi:diguanylate cyclase (GGDEF)-like protein